jgi:hypothetical protein
MFKSGKMVVNIHLNLPKNETYVKPERGFCEWARVPTKNLFWFPKIHFHPFINCA